MPARVRLRRRGYRAFVQPMPPPCRDASPWLASVMGLVAAVSAADAILQDARSEGERRGVSPTRPPLETRRAYAWVLATTFLTSSTVISRLGLSSLALSQLITGGR